MFEAKQSILYTKRNKVSELPILDIQGDIELLIYTTTNPIQESYKIEFNEIGQISKLIFHNSQHAYSSFEYDFLMFHYDEKGNNTVLKKYGENGLMNDNNGKIIEESRFEYNQQNNVINGETVRYNGRIKKRFELFYDSSQRLIGELIEDDDFALEDYSYEYDSHKQPIKDELKINGHLESWSVNSFDQFGKMISSKNYLKNGELSGVWKHDYGDHGLKIKSRIELCDGSISTVKSDYAFDRYGNWIKSNVLVERTKDGTLKVNEYVTERIIDYRR